MTILSVNGRIFPDVDAYDYWKEKFKARPMRDTVTLPPETPIQPIQQAQHALTIQELKRYLSPDSIDQVAQLVEDLDLEIKSVTAPPRANALPTVDSGSTSTTARLPEPWWNTSSCAAMTPNSRSLKKRTSRSKNAYAGPTNDSANYFKRSRSVPRPKPTSVFICCSTIFRNNISLCSCPRFCSIKMAL